MAVQQSLARTTPNASFGAVMARGLPARPGTASPFQATPALAATLEDLVAAFFELEAYARVNSPAFTADLSRTRAQLQSIAARCR